MVATMTRAHNVLAADLARENERLRVRVAALEAELSALQPERLTVGSFVVDLRSGQYWRAGLTVADEAGALTGIERRLLACLARTPGQAVPYEAIAATVWPGMTRRETIHVLQVNLNRLRKKIDPSTVTRSGAMTGSRHLRIVNGFGCLIEP